LIFEVGKEMVIPFLILDASNVPVDAGVSPTIIIKRSSDNKYWNGDTSTWVIGSYDNSMTFSFSGTYIYSFTPDIEDFYIIRCSENVTYKIEDGYAFRTVSRLSNLDYLDISVNSRLADSDFDSNITTINNKIDTIDGIVDTIDTNVGSVKSTVDTNLDVVLSTRSTLTDSEVWTYTSRTLSPAGQDGIGSCTTTIDITVDNVVAEDVNVIVYDSSRVALLSAVSNASGKVVFNLDPGNYIFEFKKTSVVYAKEIQRTIPSAVSINLDDCVAW
jgi:hypothetical protein